MVKAVQVRVIFSFLFACVNPKHIHITHSTYNDSKNPWLCAVDFERHSNNEFPCLLWVSDCLLYLDRNNMWAIMIEINKATCLGMHTLHFSSGDSM